MTTTMRPQSKPVSLSPDAENDAADPSPPALPVDLQSLPDDVLGLLADLAPKEVERRKNKREAEFLEEVRVHAQALGLTPERLKAALFAKTGARKTAHASDGRASVKPKLWNPLDHGQRWSKRGARPQWLTDFIAAGGTEEECIIPEGAV